MLKYDFQVTEGVDSINNSYEHKISAKIYDRPSWFTLIASAGQG